MSVKMPVLGDTSRRRKRFSAMPWLVVVVAIATATYAWRRKAHRPTGPSPTPTLSTPATELHPAPAGPQEAAAPGTPAPTSPRHVSLKVEGALETALIQATGQETGPALAQVLKRLLVWWIRVPGDLQHGDSIDFLYEERPGEEPVVEALRLQSGKLQRTLEAFRFRAAASESPRYYLPDGEELELRLVPSPLDGYEQVTSLIRDGRGHKGVDFKTAVGTPVKATFDGTITRKNWFFRGNGNSLEVTEASSPHRKALFLHLSELPKSLRVGTTVTAGEVIAHSGNTGHSFAPHLHYQLESADGRVLDPFQEHKTRRAALAENERPRFDALVAATRLQLSGTASEAAKTKASP